MTGSNRRKTTIAVVGFGAIGLGALAAVIAVPWWQTRSLRQGVEDYRAQFTNSKPPPLADLKEIAALEKARLDTENAMRTSLIQAVGGTVLLVGLYFTYQNLRATQRNVEIAEDKQVTERFSKAVEMLSSGCMHTRLGGIYALERIARDSDDDYWQVMEVLCAFVREESPWPPKPKKAELEGRVAETKTLESIEAPDPVASTQPVEVQQPVEASPVVESETSPGIAPQPELSEQEQALAFLATLPPLRTDVQAVMTVIGRRKHRYREGESQGLDLQNTDLRKLQAVRANLKGVDLREANLGGARLFQAHLEEASLFQAHLEEANLTEARLGGAFLFKVHLEGASLFQAHLEGATLRGAHLEQANLFQAHLEGAGLFGAHLEGAKLWSTDLFQVRGLTQEQLDSAFTDETTKLPPDLHRPKRPGETATPTPSTPPPAPAAPSPTNTEPSSPATPDPTPEPPPPAA